MNNRHSNSECVDILSAKEIEKILFISKVHSEQLDRIIKSKSKLVVYLSIFYGTIIILGLVYLIVK
jgi:hypothetical protein